MDLLAHLEAYVAVAEERSFSRAAALLDVAQPVLSRRIKTLEQELGGDLFDRSRRQIVSTDLGELLLPHAKDVLSRAEHLRQVARSVLEQAVRPIGVPADCDPSALARVIGGDHDVAVGVHELAPEEREASVENGSLALALVRVAPEAAAHVVPLGLAFAEVLALAEPGRSLHLESLRPRRGAEHTPAPPILVTTEDDVGIAAERLARAAARAGLPDARVRSVTSSATAVAETLVGRGLLLCSEPFARRHQLRWAQLADASLHRGYDLMTSARWSGSLDAATLAWLRPQLAEAIGAVQEPSGTPHGDDDGGPDARTRLAAAG